MGDVRCKAVYSCRLSRYLAASALHVNIAHVNRCCNLSWTQWRFFQDDLGRKANVTTRFCSRRKANVIAWVRMYCSYSTFSCVFFQDAVGGLTVQADNRRGMSWMRTEQKLQPSRSARGEMEMSRAMRFHKNEASRRPHELFRSHGEQPTTVPAVCSMLHWHVLEAAEPVRASVPSRC